MIELYSNEDYGKIGVRRARKKAKEIFPHLKNAVIKDDSDVTSSEDEAEEPPVKMQKVEALAEPSNPPVIFEPQLSNQSVRKPIAVVSKCVQTSEQNFPDLQ